MKFRGPFGSSKRITSRKKGFAIVMALSLLSLVFLLVISLVNLVGIDLSLADARKQRVLAQAHAKMGMMVAIGELQKHLGPDTRVSATADILDERIESGVKYESEYYSEEVSIGLNDAVTSNQAIDLNENGEIDAVPFGQRYWTGVWKHRARRIGSGDSERASKPLPKIIETGDSLGQSPMPDTSYDPHPALEVAWLVSGNEGWSRKLAIMQNPTIVGDFIEIQDGPKDIFAGAGMGVYGEENNPWRDHKLVVANHLKNYNHPLVGLPDPDESDDTVWILKRPLLESAVPDDVDPSYWKSQLRGEPIKVQKTHIRPKNSNNDRLNTHGSYAYWVGDEGVKSKANLNKPEESLGSTELEQMDDVSVATYPNIYMQKISDFISGGFGLDFVEDLIPSDLLDFGILSKGENEFTEEQSYPRKFAAHHHSLTANSFGVLADVRTGGLKRDLSHAFRNWTRWDNTFPSNDWHKDFLGFLYRDRAFVVKSVPMKPNAKSNQMHQEASGPRGETIRDYTGILSGPHWRTLASYHNLYASGDDGQEISWSNPKVKDHEADSLPRFTGDNYVLFSSAKGPPPNSNNSNPFWKDMSKTLNPLGNVPGYGNPMRLAVRSKLNFFGQNHIRPGSIRHPIQPVLMELKYSQVPTVSGNRLALAMYPSFALWNPYNVAMEMDQLYVEVPLTRASLNCFNPKEYDRWRKWFIWAFNPRFGLGGGGNNNRIMPAPKFPPGFPHYGGRGPVGITGTMGTAGYFYSLVLGAAPHPRSPNDFDHPRLGNEGQHWNFNRFHDFLTQRRLNEAHWHPKPRFFNLDPNDPQDNDLVQENFADYYNPKFPFYNLGFLCSNDPVSPYGNLNWRGIWEVNAQYLVEDAVELAGRKFVCTNPNVGQAGSRPPNGAYWEELKPTSRERHLLLGINGLRLEPGEKAHFTPVQNQSWNYEPIPSQNFRKQYLKIAVSKSNNEEAFICNTNIPISATEPWLALENVVGNIQGVHQTQVALYGDNGERLDTNLPNSNTFLYPEPKGLTMYSQDPSFGTIKAGDNYLWSSKDVSDRKPIFLTTKTFETWAGYDAWTVLTNPIAQLRRTVDRGQWTKRPLVKGGTISSGFVDAMPGNGFRIRFQLPGYSDKIVLEQFNLRALVRSFQDGFGDNWRTDRFVGSRYAGQIPNPLLKAASKEYNLRHENSVTQFIPQKMRYVDFYEFRGSNGNLNSITIADFNGTYTVDQAIVDRNLTLATLQAENPGMVFPSNPFGMAVPRIELTPVVGLFHDRADQHGVDDEGNLLEGVNRAVLFEVPRAPMLSLLQLRHANLSEYDHSPSYILGNSYAPTQVGRYKTWGRARTIVRQFLEEPITRINYNWNVAHRLFREAFSSSSSPWEWWINEENLHLPAEVDGWGWYAPMRDVDAQNEHQNTTLDHSFYANRALLDGYFMSGVGISSQSNSDFDWDPKTDEEIILGMGQAPPGEYHRPYRNKRFLPFLRDNELKSTSYAALQKDIVGRDQDFRYQTLAADLLVEGAFNINSTSVDAWISHLASLKQLPVPKGSYPSSETPLLRFLDQPQQNSWNKIKTLSDEEIIILAHCLVEQIKLRGPFLSTSDFVNRRIQGAKIQSNGDYKNLMQAPLKNWSSMQNESRNSVLGLRGTLQAAIAEAGINKLSKTDNTISNSYENPTIPDIPEIRFSEPSIYEESFLRPFSMRFKTGSFGLHAISEQSRLEPVSLNHRFLTFNQNNRSTYKRSGSMFGRGAVRNQNYFQGKNANGDLLPGIFEWTTDFGFFAGWDDYTKAASFGEAPDNLLAVEDVATAANKPDWVMQADILSPILPVSNARSDTFTIRVMGEPKSLNNDKSNKNRAWIELTVQRTPDYVKSELDAPHHRPHEPFEDRNLNGYWDNDASFREHWLDLNQNGMDEKGDETLGDAVPDLPGVGNTGMGLYADGLKSDLKLNIDEEEEDPNTKFSRMGINQRFGRKFKIIKFRWIKDQDV